MKKTYELLLGDFRSGKKEVNRLFLVGLFFILATHFYVLEPYFFFRQQETTFTKYKTDLESSIENLAKQEKELLSTKNSINAGLSGIRSTISSFPDQLRNMLPNIRDALDKRSDNEPSRDDNQDMLQMHIASTSLDTPDDINDFSGAVRWYIDNEFQKLLTDLNNSVATPLTDLARRENITGAEEIGGLSKKAIKEIQDFIRLIDPDFWHHYGGPGGKEEVARQIQRTIEHAFSPLVKKVGQILDETQTLRDEQLDSVKNLGDELEKVETNIIMLSERLETLESPFGRIPLKLIDIIKIFPFILAAIAIFMSVRLNNALNLRNILKEQFKKEQSSLPSEIREYQLGGWLFSVSKPGLSIVLLTGWFVITIALSFRAAWLIAWTEIFFKSETSFIFINQSMYKSIFTIVLILLVATAFISLKKIFHTYGNKPD